MSLGTGRARKVRKTKTGKLIPSEKFHRMKLKAKRWNPTKTFDNQKYTYHLPDKALSKKQANEIAKKLRKQGHKARIIMQKNPRQDAHGEFLSRNAVYFKRKKNNK